MADTLSDYIELYLATAYTEGDLTLDMYAKNDTYKLTDQKTSSLITEFYCVGIDRDDETQFMGMKVSNVVTNGTFQGATRYTVTLATSDGSNPMVGLANTYDGTTADANVIPGNRVSLQADSLILCSIGSGILRLLSANLANRFAQFFCFDKPTDVTVGDGRSYFQVPAKFNGDKLKIANASVITAGTTGNTTIQVHNVTQAVDMLTTPITIASGATTGSGVIDTANDDIVTGDILRIDIDSVSTTAPKGLLVNLEFGL
jgi:hypothetical protein